MSAPEWIKRFALGLVFGLLLAVWAGTAVTFAQNDGTSEAEGSPTSDQSVQPAAIEIVVSPDSLRDAGCDLSNPNEWQFNITGVLDETPPASITVITNLGPLVVPLSNHSGNVAQYDLVNAGVTTVTNATASIFDGWEGNFILSHRPCGTPTPTGTATSTPTDTPTNTPSNTPTDTPTNTPSNTPTNTPTDTPTNTPSNTPTDTPTNTPSNTPTNTPTGTLSPTNTPTNTSTSTPTNTPSHTSTSTATTDPPTRTATSKPTKTVFATHTPRPPVTGTALPKPPNTGVGGDGLGSGPAVLTVIGSVVGLLALAYIVRKRPARS